MVDGQKMRSGHWLGSVSALFPVLAHCWSVNFGDGKLKKACDTYPKGSLSEQVEKEDRAQLGNSSSVGQRPLNEGPHGCV